MLSEISAGLAAGDLVLVDPATGLSEGTRIRTVRSALPSGESAADASSRNELPVQFD